MPKQVQLSDDAYATLSALKAPGESFSDVVRRLAARKNLMDLRRLGPRIEGWDDAKFHREAAIADRKRIRRLLEPRNRRVRSP